jgi:GNAT superfamily N-acetyltransferase
MSAALNVRSVIDADRAEWEPLWQGYLTFYATSLASEITDATWQRFIDPTEPLYALVAEIDGQLVGFAHYLLHRSTWAPTCYCYLEDLFVSSAVRGRGAGRLLVDAVARAAHDADASRLYWVTHETNTQAQHLYNKLAERTAFIQYRKQV